MKHSGHAVLVASDNAAEGRELAAMLKNRGYTVRTARNGKLTLEAARANRPDLMLLDVDMPEMNGYEILGEVNSDETLKGIPVILMGSFPEPADRAGVFGAGAADYVMKPFHLEEVAARVQTHLNLCRYRRESERNGAELRDARRLRDNLVHMIAHDLRNSLTTISGYLELITLTDGKILSQKSLGYARKGSESVSALVGILNTMLDVNKMETSALKLNLMKCDLLDVAKRILADMDSAARGRLSLDASAGPVDLVADHDLIRRVIQSLIGNALKTIPSDGWVRLGIKSADGRVRVMVSDNAPAIPPEHREKLFDSFGQAEGGSGGKKYATALGLTFCKLAVEAHGGVIGVESETEEGNSFWFELTRA